VDLLDAEWYGTAWAGRCSQSGCRRSAGGKSRLDVAARWRRAGRARPAPRSIGLHRQRLGLPGRLGVALQDQQSRRTLPARRGHQAGRPAPATRTSGIELLLAQVPDVPGDQRGQRGEPLRRWSPRDEVDRRCRRARCARSRCPSSTPPHAAVSIRIPRGTGRWCPTGDPAAAPSAPRCDLASRGQDQLRRLATNTETSIHAPNSPPRGSPPLTNGQRPRILRQQRRVRRQHQDAHRDQRQDVDLALAYGRPHHVGHATTRRPSAPTLAHAGAAQTVEQRHRHDHLDTTVSTFARITWCRPAWARTPHPAGPSLGQGPLLGPGRQGLSRTRLLLETGTPCCSSCGFPSVSGASPHVQVASSRRGGPARSNRARHRPRWPRRRPGH